jgi:hypothetical protein
MSIGARAALTDHLRHVARFGVDGEATAVEQEKEQETSQDAFWNHLLDQSHFSSSTSSSEIRIQAVLAVQPDGHEAVEVSLLANSNDSSSDYFNTSRVMLLATPEKNKNRAPRILTRKEEQEFGEEEEANTTVDSIADDEIMFRATLQQDADSSFAAVDVSRISAAESERSTTPLRGSPSRRNESFMSGTWESPAKPPRHCHRSTHKTPWSPFSPPQHQDAAISPFLSPMETQAASMAVKLGPILQQPSPFPVDDMSSSSSSRALPSLQPRRASFLDPRPPSPISQANLSVFDLDCDHLHLESSSSKKNSSSGSAPNHSSGTTISPTGSDRRRYRTVVPTRVIWNVDHAMDDSFSTPHKYSSDPLPTTNRLSPCPKEGLLSRRAASM